MHLLVILLKIKNKSQATKVQLEKWRLYIHRRKMIQMITNFSPETMAAKDNGMAFIKN